MITGLRRSATFVAGYDACGARAEPGNPPKLHTTAGTKRFPLCLQRIGLQRMAILVPVGQRPVGCDLRRSGFEGNDQIAARDGPPLIPDLHAIGNAARGYRCTACMDLQIARQIVEPFDLPVQIADHRQIPPLRRGIVTQLPGDQPAMHAGGLRGVLNGRVSR
jgi:hypothetical protein